MAAKNSMRHIQVDEDLKEQATQALAAMEESRAMMASRRVRLSSASTRNATSLAKFLIAFYKRAA